MSLSNEFEIYTTADAGNNWVAVNGSNIPNPLSGEWLATHNGVGDTMWIATSQGRVFRSADKGYTWSLLSVIPYFQDHFLYLRFRNGNYGLATDHWQNRGFPGHLFETFDGGLSWSEINYSGPLYHTDLSYVPGTMNTWVSSGGSARAQAGQVSFGASYSLDGGHSWTDFPGTHGTRFFAMAWLNNHCGYAGGVSKDSTKNGAFKFTGVIPDWPVGITGSKQTYEVVVYPNPVSDLLTIEAGVNITQIMLINMLGQAVKCCNLNQKSVKFDISGMEPGIYTLRVAINDKYSTRKIIIR